MENTGRSVIANTGKWEKKKTEFRRTESKKVKTEMESKSKEGNLSK